MSGGLIIAFGEASAASVASGDWSAQWVHDPFWFFAFEKCHTGWAWM